ncbi:hypothetical protein [Polyangium sp. 15x6]|uniref:hypothetical protein n=1 Tax=Polyangium sp. 15x6 TaxID=3042687 RepID=UPI002499FD92|nr:hypothetical protein [Polyangium sp. 15x6]MDI3282606.1 hypothetical protein [Polyangium sp. 15x6]
MEGTTTLFSFVFNNSVQGFYNLDGPVFAKLAKQRQCVTSGPNTTCDDIPGKFELLVWTRGKPKDASLRLHKDGQLVANRDIVPTYVPTAPSEECAPMCEQSITEWILP